MPPRGRVPVRPCTARRRLRAGPPRCRGPGRRRTPGHAGPSGGPAAPGAAPSQPAADQRRRAVHQGVGSPQVSARRTSGSAAPRSNHCVTCGSSATQSVYDSEARGPSGRGPPADERAAPGGPRSPPTRRARRRACTRPTSVVPRGAGVPGPGDPAGASAVAADHVFPAAPQVARGLNPVEGGAEGALPVREVLGQGLHGDVRALGQPVHIRGDRPFAGRQVEEVPSGAGALPWYGAFAVAGVGHGVRGRVRGRVHWAGGGTKVGVSHGSDSFSCRSCGQTPAGVGSTGRGLFVMWAR
ncbi:hypothetical protein SALBM135S_04319 [Streptomyces alboniger]